MIWVAWDRRFHFALFNDVSVSGTDCVSLLHIKVTPGQQSNIQEYILCTICVKVQDWDWWFLHIPPEIIKLEILTILSSNEPPTILQYACSQRWEDGSVNELQNVQGGWKFS